MVNRTATAPLLETRARVLKLVPEVLRLVLKVLRLVLEVPELKVLRLVLKVNRLEHRTVVSSRVMLPPLPRLARSVESCEGALSLTWTELPHQLPGFDVYRLY
jgi:hypothetical protein